MKKKNIIVFFDFDGTITLRDSMFHFIFYSKGLIKTFIGLIFLSPILISFKFNLIKNTTAKKKLISYFFKGIKKEKFEMIAKEYSLTKIDNIVRPEALKKIIWHKQQNHKIVIVSASIQSWLKPWCDKHNFDLLATQLEFKNNICTGDFISKNCNGIEKVNRINNKYDLNEYISIYAYGDSTGDKAMIGIADKKFYRKFE